ncbi:hypothetical protein [Planococcus sp. YIM B11945]
MNKPQYAWTMALPFFVLWITLDNIVYLCIAIALGVSMGTSSKKKENKSC